MPNLTRRYGSATLLVKRDDCTELVFGGNKVRQLEFYLGQARDRQADTVVITGAVQSNFVRMTAGGARKLGMHCHIQLEERVSIDEPHYRDSGNVLLDRLLGATVHAYPAGEDEAGADRTLEQIAATLRADGHTPYIIPLGPGHPPYGALGYVLAAREILDQIGECRLAVDELFVGSGSGASHAGLLFGLRTLGSNIRVTGVCVRRPAEPQREPIRDTCEAIATLLDVDSPVTPDDLHVTDEFFAPGYGLVGDAARRAMVLAAQDEGLLVDPVYTAKVLAAVLERASSAPSDSALLFVHTGGTPALFAYRDAIARALAAAESG